MDTTERLHFHFSLSCTGEGNGNPLQCSCLENPRAGGAWWVAVSGVTQSRTRLKRLSSSSSSSKGGWGRSWVGAKDEGCPNQPGVGVGRITLPSHPTIYPALSLLSCLPLGKLLNLSGPQFSHLENRIEYARVHAKSLQPCLILCSPMDCSLPGSSVHGILQARLLGWVTLPSSRRSSQPRD